MNSLKRIGGRDYWVRSAKRGARVLHTMVVWWVHGIGAQLIALGLLGTFGVFYGVTTELGLGPFVGVISGLLSIPLVLTIYGGMVLDPGDEDDPRELSDEGMKTLEEKKENRDE